MHHCPRLEIGWSYGEDLRILLQYKGDPPVLTQLQLTKVNSSEALSNKMESPELWDTFGLFESLLNDFETHLYQAQHGRSSWPTGTEQMRIAICGFMLFCPVEAWSQEESKTIESYESGDFSLDALEWYEESAEAVQHFACLALGAMLGKRAADTLDDQGFLFGYAHLVAFLTLHNEAIFEQYSAFPNS